MAPITRSVTSYREDNHLGSLSEEDLFSIIERLTAHNVEYAMPPITSQAIGPNKHFNNLMDRVSTAVRIAAKTGDMPVLYCIKAFAPNLDWNIPPVVNPLVPDVQLHDVQWVDKINNAIQGCTPLHIAAMYGQQDVMHFLLDHGMPVDVGVPTLVNPPTAFYYGIHTQHAKMVAGILLYHGADPNKLVSEGGKPLVIDAIRRSCFETASLLLDTGVDCNLESVRSKNPLHLCSGAEPPKEVDYDKERAWVIVVTKLLDLNFSATQRDTFGRTPLHYAAMRKQGSSAEVMNLLYSKGARSTDRDNCRLTPLILLCRAAYTSKAALDRLDSFLDEWPGLDLDQENASGSGTCVSSACWASKGKGEKSLQIRVAETLLEHGADGRHILFDLIKWPGTWPAVKLLVHKGCINDWSHTETIDLYLQAKGTGNRGYIERCAYCLNDVDWETIEEMKHRRVDMHRRY